MIGKEVASGSGFRGVLAYIEDREQHTIGFVDSRNLAHDDIRGIAREMRALACASTRIWKPVKHFVLSWQPGEAVDRCDMTRSADRFLAHLGLEDRQARFVMHDEKGHKHLHLVVNSVGLDGKGWNPKQSKILAIEAGREVARELNFVAVTRDLAKERDPERPRPKTAQEQRIEERTGRPPLHERELGVAVEALRESATWDEAHDRLARRRLGIVAYADSKNPKRSGLSLVDLETGETCALSALGSRYGKAAIQKRLGPFIERSNGREMEIVDSDEDTPVSAESLQAPLSFPLRECAAAPVSSLEVPAVVLPVVPIAEVELELFAIERSACEAYGPKPELPRTVEERIRANPTTKLLSENVTRAEFGARYQREYSEDFEKFNNQNAVWSVADFVLAFIAESKHKLAALVAAGVETVRIAFDRGRSLSERFDQIRAVIRQAFEELEDFRRERAEQDLVGPDLPRVATPAIGSRYAGIIEAIDDRCVYQRIANGELISHERASFGEDRADELELAIRMREPQEIGYEFDGPMFGPARAIESDLPDF